MQICRQHNIEPYLGGGIIERAIRDSDISSYMKQLDSYQISTIEVSNTKGFSQQELLSTLQSIRKDCDYLLYEVGKKESFDPDYERVDQWINELDFGIQELNADEIILEGALENDVGIYERDGRAKTFLVSLLWERVDEMGLDPYKKIIIESSKITNQLHWISNCFGLNTQLGNIQGKNIKELHHEKQRIQSLEESTLSIDRLRKITIEAIELCKTRGLDYNVVLLDPQFSTNKSWNEDNKSSLFHKIRNYIPQNREFL